ncbi:hypothetical protein SZ64_04500 [Erythrobacter sp. SG61-1L]|uniref:hypothetical protein n=1 Tax=Erythrobacter sp. SG61-1L TaxID=1603897 RepID=UPI0006C8F47C|nr:hypothetical protein [Erythrobacter sp. SG61-1L]KPL67428.1 hypothetical protein SZ64_04500 [Erythrobacter sp. SG61-1L]
MVVYGTLAHENLLLRHIEAVADAGTVLEGNTGLADAIGLTSSEQVQKLFSKLVIAKRIKVQIISNRRVVTVLETGKRTGKPVVPKSKNHVPRDRSERPPAQVKEEAAPVIQTRDPCIACGVPYHRHDRLGCKRWRVL